MHIQNDALFKGRDYLGIIKDVTIDHISKTATITTLIKKDKTVNNWTFYVPSNEIIVADPNWIY